MATRSTVGGVGLLVDTHAAAASLSTRAVPRGATGTGTIATRFARSTDMAAGATVFGVVLQIRLTTIVQVAIAVAKPCIAANATCAC